MNAGQVNWANSLKKGLNGKKSNTGLYSAEMLDPWYAILFVLHGHSQPGVPWEFEIGGVVGQALGALCEDLEGVFRAAGNDVEHLVYKGVWDTLVEKVGHRVYEIHGRLFSLQGLL